MCEHEYLLSSAEQEEYGNALRRLIDPHVTPISYFHNSDDSVGYHLGTGYFFEHGNRRYLMTNQHVAFPNIPGVDLSNISLAFLLDGEERYVRVTNPFASFDYPTDVACSVIDDTVWDKYHGGSICLPPEKFEDRFEAVEKEFFFLEGFPGQRARMLGDSLLTHLAPLLTHRIPLIEGFDSAVHFAVHFDIDKYRCSGEQTFLTSPEGMSGSLIWNTKIQECKQKRIPWNADMPKIVGIVHRYCSEEKRLIATKIESMKKDELAKLALTKRREAGEARRTAKGGTP